MSAQTISILTSKEVIALNQDPLVYQARKIKDYGEQEVWAKPLISTMSGKVAVALLNRANQKADITLNVDSAGIESAKGYTLRNIWDKKDFRSSENNEVSFSVAPHGIVVLTISGTSKPYNVFQHK
ncbi:MAG: hypothetical protein ABI760_23980 [Ferruginibacter sp.]